MEKYIPCTWKAKESWSSNLHTRQNDFKIKNITRDKEGHYIMIKGSIQEEDITTVNIYAPNIRAPQYIKTNTAAKSLQSCPTLCDPIDSSPPGSPVPGILQARTLEWVAVSFSKA